MNESKMLASYTANCSYADLPKDAVITAKKSFLDAVGVTLAASGLSPECRAFVGLAVEEKGKQESTILGYPQKVSASMAAFANGAMAHAMDFEDAHDTAIVHPNAAVVPAALAVAESIGNITGKEFITALAIGSDIVCRLGLALDKDPADFGWYTPPILSAFGAAASVCKLLKLLDAQTTEISKTAFPFLKKKIEYIEAILTRVPSCLPVKTPHPHAHKSCRQPLQNMYETTTTIHTMNAVCSAVSNLCTKSRL